MKLKSILAFILAYICCLSVSAQLDLIGLKTVFKSDFLIGSAVNSNQILEKDTKAKQLIESQFNTLSPENIMKCEIIHPEWDKYDFTLADKYADYCKKNGMFTVGHTLIWHSQLSPFVRRINSADSLKLFMQNHINTVAGRYKNKVNGWDVVNEALEEDGTFRKSIFLNLLGENYLVDAFKLAEKAAPNTELYYNDYNIEQAAKRQGALKLLKLVQSSGARIDGVGIQGHWSINNLPLKEIEESIIAYSNLGLKVMITELDLTVLPNPWDLKGAEVTQNFEGSAFMNPYPEFLPDSIQIKLANAYADLFKLFVKHQDKISRVTFWGVNDGNSWLNNWPIKKRKNYPLLFDTEYKAKPAFNSVVNIKKLK